MRTLDWRLWSPSDIWLLTYNENFVGQKIKYKILWWKLFLIFSLTSSACSRMHQQLLISFIHMDCDGLDRHGFLSLKATLVSCSYSHTAKQSPYNNQINSVHSYFLGSVYVSLNYLNTCLSELWWLVARTSLKLNSTVLGWKHIIHIFVTEPRKTVGT